MPIGALSGSAVALQYETTVARKALELQRQQGAQALQLIEQAGAAGGGSASLASPRPGPLPPGSTISVYA